MTLEYKKTILLIHVSFTPDLGGFLWDLFYIGRGGAKLPLSKMCWDYARNLKFGT